MILSRGECQALKGLAIVMIVLHNLCHWTRLSGGTNEYFFRRGASNYLVAHLQHVGWDTPYIVLSQVGQFGVQIFLFLSAYGLVLKYEQGRGVGTGRWAFISEHYLKLWRLMIIGLVAALTLGSLLDANCLTTPEHWWPMALMVGNLLPDPESNIFPGPYWYLGLTVEVYVIYRLCLMVKPGSARWKRWAGPVAFFVVTLIPQLLVDPTGKDGVLTYMRYNFVIAGVPFAAGLLAARYLRLPQLRRWVWLVIALVGVAAFLRMQTRFVPWLLSPLVLIVGVVALVRACSGSLLRPVVWLGTISSALFIVHPIVRIFADNWLRANHIGDSLTLHMVLLVYFVTSVVASVGYRWLIGQLPGPKGVNNYKA